MKDTPIPTGWLSFTDPAKMRAEDSADESDFVGFPQPEGPDPFESGPFSTVLISASGSEFH